MNCEYNVFYGFVPVICYAHDVIKEFVDINLALHIRNILYFLISLCIRLSSLKDLPPLPEPSEQVTIDEILENSRNEQNGE